MPRRPHNYHEIACRRWVSKQYPDFALRPYAAKRKIAKECVYRQTGDSTRRADRLVQRLFDSPNEWVIIIDGYVNLDKPGAMKRSDLHLLEVVRKRLDFEHRGVKYTLDHDKIAIKLVI